MDWRPFRSEDLETCLGIEPACLGDSLTGRDEALRRWCSLLESASLHGSVIETGGPGGTPRIVACGIGVFVDSAFADRELESPKPGLNSRVVESIGSADSVVLDRDAVAAGNAGKGLDFINLIGNWSEEILDEEKLTEVQLLLGTSFIENLAGFRFRRVLKEAIGAATIELARATQTYRLVAEFPEQESALFALTPESARAAPYSLAARLYRYQTPVLKLRPAEQALLEAALDGKTDAELSATLGISIEAVKKRWISVFSRVEQQKPAILARSEIDAAGRGPQKRHRIIAWVREHREELRPYSW